jgi:hypothetical protein
LGEPCRAGVAVVKHARRRVPRRGPRESAVPLRPARDLHPGSSPPTFPRSARKGGAPLNAPPGRRPTLPLCRRAAVRCKRAAVRCCADRRGRDAPRIGSSRRRWGRKVSADCRHCGIATMSGSKGRRATHRPHDASGTRAAYRKAGGRAQTGAQDQWRLLSGQCRPHSGSRIPEARSPADSQLPIKLSSRRRSGPRRD